MSLLGEGVAAGLAVVPALHDKLLYICAEVRRDTPVFFQAHQNDFQSMITGEEINVAFKGKTARVVTWQSQGLLCGNQMFKVSDAGGSIHPRGLFSASPRLDDPIDRAADAAMQARAGSYKAGAAALPPAAPAEAGSEEALAQISSVSNVNDHAPMGRAWT